MKPLDTALENQFTPRLDSAGYVVGGTLTRSRADALGFLALLRDARIRFPFDPIDIVWPLGWPVDEDGRGLSVLEQSEAA